MRTGARDRYMIVHIPGVYMQHKEWGSNLEHKLAHLTRMIRDSYHVTLGQLHTHTHSQMMKIIDCWSILKCAGGGELSVGAARSHSSSCMLFLLHNSHHGAKESSSLHEARGPLP